MCTYHLNGFVSDCDTLSEIEIIELVDAKTKLIEAKCVSEIELIKAKYLSKAERMELITDDCSKNPCQKGQGKNTAD